MHNAQCSRSVLFTAEKQCWKFLVYNRFKTSLLLELVYCRKACHINFNALTLDIAKPLLLIKSLFFRTKLYREDFYVTTIFTVLFDKWPLIFQLIVQEFILKMLIHYYYNSRPNLQLRRKSFWFKNRIFVYFIKKAKLFFFIFLYIFYFIFSFWNWTEISRFHIYQI